MKDVFLALAPESKELVRNRTLDLAESTKFTKVVPIIKICRYLGTGSVGRYRTMPILYLLGRYLGTYLFLL